jgi:hypothetical protein
MSVSIDEDMLTENFLIDQARFPKGYFEVGFLERSKGCHVQLKCGRIRCACLASVTQRTDDDTLFREDQHVKESSNVSCH